MRKTILIVDDEELSRALLSQMFVGEYNVIMATKGREAINEISKHMKDIAVILLDLVMPDFNGYQVLQVLSAKNITDRIPVVMITAQKDVKVEMACYALGAVNFINKPYVAQVVQKRVSNVIEMYQRQENLETKIKEQKAELYAQQLKLEQFYDKLIDAVSNIVEFRDLETGDHIKRVKGLTKIMAQTYMNLYPESGLTPEKINTIVRASALHDIGKIAVPDHILLKPASLTNDERQVMMSHTTKGCEILNKLSEMQDEEQFRVCYDVCRYHHERYDGRGYPDNLKQDQIPLSAQLVSIADVYDALVSERVYKKAYDKEKAYQMIVGGECGDFGPKIFTCFKQARSVIEAYVDNQK